MQGRGAEDAAVWSDDAVCSLVAPCCGYSAKGSMGYCARVVQFMPLTKGYNEVSQGTRGARGHAHDHWPAVDRHRLVGKWHRRGRSRCQEASGKAERGPLHAVRVCVKVLLVMHSSQPKWFSHESNRMNQSEEEPIKHQED